MHLRQIFLIKLQMKNWFGPQDKGDCSCPHNNTYTKRPFINNLDDRTFQSKSANKKPINSIPGNAFFLGKLLHSLKSLHLNKKNRKVHVKESFTDVMLICLNKNSIV